MIERVQNNEKEVQCDIMVLTFLIHSTKIKKIINGGFSGDGR